MSLYESFQQGSAAPAPVATPAPAKTGVVSKVTNFLGGLFGNKNTPAENTGSAQATPPVAADQPQPSSLYDAFKATQPAAPASQGLYGAFKQAKSTPSPYFSKTTPSGAVLGFSDEKDSTGKPFLAYRNPGDTSTTTDKTRVATTFDPTKPQKIDSKTFYNPRDPNVTKLRGVMGASYNEELDHVQPLELSGSNDKSNLQLEKATDSNAAYGGDNPTPTDPLENKLKSDVASGKKSLLDAQIEMAKDKGKPAPWSPPEYRSKNGWDNFKSYVTDIFAGKAKPSSSDDTLYDAHQRQASTFDASKAEPGISLGKPGSAMANSTPQALAKSDPAAVEHYLDPASETDFPKIPFTTDEEMKKAGKLTGPLAVTLPAKFLFSLPSMVIQAVSRMSAVLEREGEQLGKNVKESVSGNGAYSEPTEKLNPFMQRLYGEPEYKTTVRDIQDRIANGDGVVASYLGAVSQKVLDVAFGASVAASGLRVASKLLASGSDNATIEAWKTLGSPETQEQLDANYRLYARQFHPDVQGGSSDAMSVINKAKDVLEDKGIPNAIDLYRNKAASYAEWASRETKLGDPLLTPNLKVRPVPEGGTLPFKQLSEPSPEAKVKDEISSSEAFDVQSPISSGEVPREKIYASGNTLKPEFAQGRIDDITEKLDGYKQGLGKEFRGMVDPSKVTMDGNVPEDLVTKAHNLVDLAAGKPTTIPITSMKQAQFYPVLGRDEPLLDSEIADIENENPGLVRSIRNGDKIPPIPVRALPDGTFVPDGDGATRYMAYKYLGVKDVPVELTSADPSSTFAEASYKKISGPLSAKGAADLQRDNVATGLTNLSSDDFVNEGGKANLDLYGESEDIIGKIEKGTATAEDIRRGSEILATVQKEVTALKAAPGLANLTTKIIDQLQGRDTVSKQFIQDLTNQGDLKQAERDIIRDVLKDEGDTVNVKDFTDKVKAELLPLRVADRETSGGGGTRNIGRYENISLPEDLRGDVENYGEKIYTSPIKTSAGDVHFSDQQGFNSAEGPGKNRSLDSSYFGHSRIEDMADGSTRRVIEVQSDLYQKGVLDRELLKGSPDRNVTLSTNPKLIEKQREKLAKLYQYSNPTAHFRMVREEVRQAAIDGKRTLLFPTGETAMKIEGLGSRDTWWAPNEGGNVRMKTMEVSDLSVGKEIERGGHGMPEKWIITDVLGDGKFKAVPKNIWDESKSIGKGEVAPGVPYTEAMHRQSVSDRTESFDISGKVDTSNPIYRFYEKDLGRYLKNRYGSSIFKDDKGVSWYKVDVKPEYGDKPVEAFKLQKGSDIEKLAKAQGVDFNTAVSEYRSIVSQFFDDKEVSFLFPEKIAGEAAWGRMQIRRAFQNPLIEVVQKDGKISDKVLYHESFHAYIRQFMSKADRDALLDSIKKNPFARAKMKLAYEPDYGKDLNTQAEEYAADAFADFMQGKGSPLRDRSIFQKILDKLRDWIRKVTKLEKTFKRMLEKDRSYVRKETRNLKPETFEKKIAEPLSENEKKTVDAFTRSSDREPVGMIEGKTAVIGSYGRNAIERKTVNGQTDRLPISEVSKTLEHVKEAYVAGDSGFRKDNIVHIAEMPDGENRAVVTRENNSGQEEVINLFKIGRDIKIFTDNLKQFGIPTRTRTGISSLERSSSNPLKYRDTGSVSKGVGDVKGRTASIYNRKNMDKDLSVEDELDREAELEMNLVNQAHANELTDLEERGLALEHEREALENNPARGLAPYVSKSGEFKGRLREVTGEVGTKFGQKGDQIITELGFTDSEKAREAWEKYAEKRDAFTEKIKAFQDSKRELYQKFKEDREKYANSTTRPAGKYNEDIAKANGGIVPPTVRGGLKAPEMDLTKFKDISVPRLGRDTMERNIEKVAGQYAPELKDFVIEPVRSNEVDRVKYTNRIRKDARDLMKKLGLKPRSNEADLIQRYGEGYLSIEELNKATPKWKEVMQATDYYRKLYDRLLDEWNSRRAKFGYSAVPKRPDYFRHFNDINEFTNQFGLLRKEGQLPTEIAGMTEFFRPGKPFSTAELHRIGNMTSYDAIRGMDNYLESVSKQMFHIDSIQRGRALEKYIRKVARENTSLKLPNFVQNVEEWTNLVSGKAAKLDRAIESVAGRPVMKFLLKLSNILGRNIVVGNISVAMTHLVSLPLNAATVDKVPFIRGGYSTLVSPLKAEPINMVDGIESSFLTRRYPEKYILPTTFQKITDTLSYLFHISDVFKSKLAVSSKYYEGLSKGLSKEEAMREADTYAGRIVGDYSTGNRPNILNTHTTKLIAQFQLGVNDGMSVLMHDIPHWEKGNKAKIATRLVQFFVFAYLFNRVYRAMRGSGKALDPIDAGLTIAGLNDEGSGQDFVSRLKLAGGDLLGELPGGSVIAGDFPLAQAFPVMDVLTGKKTWQDFLKQFMADFASPVGGGTQAKKTLEGYQAYKQGYTTTPQGKISKTVDQTPTNLLKGLIFGKSGFTDVSDQNNETSRLMGFISAKTATSQQEAESLNQQFKNMSPDKARAAWSALHAKDVKLADQVAEIALEQKEGMTLNERLIKQLGVTNGQRATYIYKKLQDLGSDAERKALWQRYVTLKIISPNVAGQLNKLIKK